MLKSSYQHEAGPGAEGVVKEVRPYDELSFTGNIYGELTKYGRNKLCDYEPTGDDPDDVFDYWEDELALIEGE